MSSQIYTVNKHSGKATMVLELDNTLVTAISASNDGKLVAIGTSKGDVVLADTATFRSLRRFSGYRRPVTDIGFLGASDHLFSADAGGLVVGWNTRVN